MRDTAIAVQRVSFSYKRNSDPVFSDFSLTIFANEITCILGHNGAGKTTLLNLIYGLLRSETGSVSIADPGVQSYRDIFLFAGGNKQNRDLSTRQLIRFREFAFKRSRDAAIEKDLVGQFNFDKHLDTPIKNLSAGNKVRASCIAGISFDPTLLLLDEPTNSIDPETRECLKVILREQKRHGATVVLVTHDIDFAHAVCDRAFVIERGKLVREDGEVSALGRDEFVEQYLRFTAERNSDD